VQTDHSISGSRSSSLPRNGARAWGGVTATALILVLIEVLGYTRFRVPVPISVAILGAVYTALVGGTAFGLLSAALIAAYALYTFSIPDQPLHYTYDSAWRVTAALVLPTLLVLVIGHMRRKGERFHASLRETAVLEAQLAERRKIEQELRRQRTEQQTIFHAVPAMIWFKDKHNRILRANHHAAASIGRTVEEVEGRSTAELYPTAADKYLHDDLEVSESGKPKLGIIERYEVAGGTDRWVRTDKIPYRDENGTILGVIVFAVDITEQKQAQDELLRARTELEQRIAERTAELTLANQSLRREIVEREHAEELRSLTEQRLQQIIDNSTAVIYGKDVDGRYWLVNRQFEEIFHLPREQILCRTDAEIFPAHEAEAFRSNDQLVLRTGTPIEFEEVAPHHDGPHNYISLKFPLLDATGHSVALCGISTDITERKQREEELRSYATALEKANRDLAEAREAAESANRAKSRFLANISHEIRTPIMAMLGAAELVSAGETSAPDAPDRGNMILRNGRHLLALIDELLDVSRIEAGKLGVKREPCALADVLADVEAVTEPLRRGRALDCRVFVETPLPETINSDRTRLTQALANLVNNAMKFTAEGYVHLRVRADRAAADPRLTFLVEDTGIGIRPEDRERIFETFAQVDPIPRGASAGAGLGLPIARWIAQRLGGGLTVEPNPGGGSRFVLRVATGELETAWIKPEDFATPLCSSGGPTTHAALPRLRGCVLVAEDADDARELITLTLHRAGAEVVAVSNGRDAVHTLKTRCIELALLDIRMPELDGLDAAAQIRADGYRGAMIALTASTSGSESERILAAGFDDIWPKPISLDELVERASAFLDVSPTDRESRPTVAPRATPTTWNRAVAGFVASLDARMTSLRDAQTSADAERLKTVLHQLVGAGGLHGFMDLSYEAARLLAQLKTDSTTADRLDLGPLQRLVDAARVGPRTVVRGPEAGAPNIQA